MKKLILMLAVAVFMAVCSCGSGNIDKILEKPESELTVDDAIDMAGYLESTCQKLQKKVESATSDKDKEEFIKSLSTDEDVLRAQQVFKKLNDLPETVASNSKVQIAARKAAGEMAKLMQM